MRMDVRCMECQKEKGHRFLNEEKDLTGNNEKHLISTRRQDELQPGAFLPEYTGLLFA